MADSKISAFPAATTLTGAELLAGVQSAANVKVTADQVKTYTRTQVVNFASGAVATGTTTVPNDDTIPQSNEGDQYLSLAITPRNAASLLVIEAVMQLSPSASVNIITSLFQDAVASALVTGLTIGTMSNFYQINLRYFMIAGMVSATTFKVRAGGSSAATLTLNGVAGSRQFGGVLGSSITISEYGQ